jgi:hypothetical protein
MRVVVEHSVPVMVEVETETGEVVAVGVADHYVEPRGDFFDEKGQPLPEAAEVCGEALRVAEQRLWPRWRFGA